MHMTDDDDDDDDDDDELFSRNDWPKCLTLNFISYRDHL